MTPLTRLLRDTAVPVLPAATTDAAGDGGDGGERMIALRLPRQERSNWCWCAVTAGICRHYDPGFSLSQCETASVVLGIADACERAADPDVDTPFALDAALSTFGHFAALRPRIAFDMLRAEIDAGRPVAVHVLFVESGLSHFAVVLGYRSQPEPTLLVDDPLHGASAVSLDLFVGAYRGDGRWRHSFLTQ